MARAEHIDVGFDPTSHAEFRAWLEKLGPEKGTTFLRKSVSRLSTRMHRHVRGTGYSRSGGQSVGVGAGGKYGHLRDHLYRRFGARYFGFYIRIGFSRDGAWKARFFEHGTVDRFAKSWRGKKLSKRRYTGKLEARAPMARAYDRLNKGLIIQEYENAVVAALKASARRPGR